jgi:Protein of unknown function (DUF1565)
MPRLAFALPPALVIALGLLGCGSESKSGPEGDGGGGAGGAEACPAPNRMVGDRCLEPGVQDDGCPAGQLGRGDGSCQAAGVPPELCAEGFTHDGDAGCEPVLPSEPCPNGSMAVPGESQCHPVMDCGSGKWGDIPIDDDTIHVDQSYGGGASDGSQAQPFTTIVAAVAAASTGALIAVAAGSYQEDVFVDRSVRLWGVCPEQVSVEGQGTTIGAIDIQVGASGTEVVGLAVTTDSNAASILVAGAEDVTLERLWVHDGAGRGINVQNDLGPTSVTVRDVLVEANHEIGVFVAGSQLDLAAVVVRDTLPRVSDQTSGRGIVIQASPMNAMPSIATVTGSLIERNHEAGVVIEGSEAGLEGLVVRDTAAQPSDQASGRGLVIQANNATSAPANVTVTGALIERNHEIGVLVMGSQATLEGLVVRDTLPRPSDQDIGRGINIQPDFLNGDPANVTVSSSLIEKNHDVGILVMGSQATLEGLVVRDTLPRQNDQIFGRGIQIQIDPATGAPSTGSVVGSLVERNLELGVAVVGSQATFAGVAVRQTAVRASDGLFGDGIVALNELGPAAAVVDACLSEDNARAGLISFGSGVALSNSASRCNALDLAGEPIVDEPFVFDDLGGNECGCGETTGACKAATTGLAPPEPVDESL